MSAHEIEVRVMGAFALSEDLVTAVGDALEAAGMVDPIITANLAAGVLDISVEVDVPTAADAHRLASEAVGSALIAAGAVDSWAAVRERQAVIA